MPFSPDRFCCLRRLLPRALAAMLVLSVAVGCGDKKDSEASYIQRGRELAEKGDIAGADILLRNALQINPKSAEAMYLLAANAEKRGDPRAAYQLYLRVTEEQPSHVAAQAKVGQIYAAGGDLNRAREQLDKAVALDPQHLQVLLLQGLIDFRSGQLDQARERATAVLAKDPGNVDATGLLARALEEQGRLDEAVAAYDAALQRHPDLTVLRMMKTKALERGKRFEAAEASYGELIRLEPAAYTHRRDLARSLEERGQAAAAEAVIRAAIAADAGGVRPKLDLVDLLIRQNKADAAEAELIRMASAAPQEYPLQFKLADRYLRTERAEPAKTVLEGIVGKDPEGPNGIGARTALARIALREGQGETADARIAEVLKLEPGNDDALLMRAGRALARNDPEPAIVDLRTVLRDVPDSIEAKRMLASAYFMAGKSDLAEKQLVALTEQNASDLGAKYDLAYLQARRGASGEALALLDDIATAAPAAAAPLRAKAMMLMADKKWAGAEETIRQLAALPDQQRLADMLYGVLYLSSDRPKEAVTAFERAHKAAPTASAPINGVVRAYLRQGDIDGASRFLRRLIAENPDSGYLQNSYGELLLVAGKPAEAVAPLEKANALSPDAPLPYFNLARAYVATGNPAKGIALLDAGLMKAPGDLLLLRAKADAQLVSGQQAEALATYLKIVEISPEDDNAANNAAALIADDNYRDPAALKRAVELVKRFEDANSPNYLDTLGWVRYRAGEYELAKVALTRAARRLPDEPQIQYHLGMVRFKLGDRDGAREALTKAVLPGATYPGIEEARETLKQLGGAKP